MRKNLFDRILKGESKKQYLSTVPSLAHSTKVHSSA